MTRSTIIKIPQCTAPQYAFWKDRARFRLFVGGVGSGKTYAGVIEVLQQPAGSVGMIISPTFRMLSDTVVRDIRQHLAQVIDEDVRGDKTIVLKNGTQILLRSGDDADRLRGPNLGWVWLDEAAMMQRDVWDVAIGRLRLSPGRAWITTTPRGRNWVYDLSLRCGDDPNYSMTRAATYTNTFTDPGFVASMREAYTSDYAQQEIEGEFISGQGLIFRREWFTRTSDVPPNARWVRYWDLAMSVSRTADYTASVAMTQLPDGRVLLRDMIRGKWEWPQARKIIAETIAREGYSTAHAIERAAHGLAAYQDLRTMPEIAGYGLRSIVVQGDKVTRANSWAVLAESRKLQLVHGLWNDAFIDEACRFPHGKHDDQIDSVSGGFPMIRTMHRDLVR